MRPYTFYLHDGVHPVPGFDFVQCADDQDALAHAARLLEQFQEYEFIEVYDGQRQRLRIARDRAPVRDISVFDEAAA
jgi:hypothetical protein